MAKGEKSFLGGARVPTSIWTVRGTCSQRQRFSKGTLAGGGRNEATHSLEHDVHEEDKGANEVEAGPGDGVRPEWVDRSCKSEREGWDEVEAGPGDGVRPERIGK